MAPSLGPIVIIYTDTSQDPSNKPSRLTSAVPSLEHSNHPSYIPLYVPIRDTYTDTSTVPIILLFQKPSLVSLLFLIIITSNDPSQVQSNKFSVLPYAVPSADYYVGPGYTSTYKPSY